VVLLRAFILSLVFGTSLSYAGIDNCSKQVQHSWRRIELRYGTQPFIPRALLGRRAMIVLPQEVHAQFGTDAIEGIIETIPTIEGSIVSGEFVVVQDNGQRISISATVLPELR
jgi:hypothetical protein